ncbi:MAG TPA: hypothetical protein VF220_02380 [Nitrososphaeraceae archaeon]
MALQTISLYGTDQTVFGKSYSEWILDWWKWFYDAEEETEHQNESWKNDSYDVRFLTTVHNFEPDMYTKSHVIQDQAILLSVAKWISLGLPFQKDIDLMKAATERINTLETMRVEVDGQKIKPQRLATDIFNLELKREVHNPKTDYCRIETLRKGKYKAIGDGYWLFIKPNQFDKGIHTIDTFCSCASNIVRVNVHHTLNII